MISWRAAAARKPGPHCRTLYPLSSVRCRPPAVAPAKACYLSSVFTHIGMQEQLYNAKIFLVQNRGAALGARS